MYRLLRPLCGTVLTTTSDKSSRFGPFTGCERMWSASLNPILRGTSDMVVSYRTIDIDGHQLFYREAGEKGSPKIALFGGFPSSSHQWRNLVPALAERGFHVVSPDYPGFGYTVYPDDFTFTFDRISEIIEGWLMELEFTHFGLYHQDYGG